MSRNGERQRAQAIEELRDLEEEPTEGFFGRVQRSIERRQLASDTVDLSWTVVQVMVLEALDMIFQVLGRRRTDKGDGR